MLDIKPYLKAVSKATQANNHTEARRIIATYVKKKHNGPDLEKCFDAIATLHNFYDYMPVGLFNIRKDIAIKTYSLLNESEAIAFTEVL